MAWTLAICAWAAGPDPACAAEPTLATAAAEAFWRGDFATLDKQNELLKHGKHIDPDGRARLGRFRDGLNSVFDSEVEHSDPYLREMEALTLQWAVAHPESPLAHALHAKAIMAHAWVFRGNGPAKDVPPQAWKDFRDHLEKAAQYLRDHASVALSDSYGFVVMLSIGCGLDLDPATLATIQREGLKLNPNDITLYFDMLGPLLPKWGGDAKTLDDYIRGAASRTKADYGMGMYADLYSAVIEEGYDDGLFEKTRADWPTLKQGFEDMLARFPDRTARRNRFAYMACLAKDRSTLRSLLTTLGTETDKSQWGPNPERSLEECQRWAKET